VVQDEIVLALAGEIDVSTAPLLRAALVEVLEGRPVRVTLDLTELSFLDAGGIRCLVDAARRAAAVGCALTVHNATGMVLRVMQLTDTFELLAPQSSDANAESH
jgi:anti-sigma B factor antagonist